MFKNKQHGRKLNWFEKRVLKMENKHNIHLSTFERIVLKLTHKIWLSRIAAILDDEYIKHTINSKQLHEIAAAFEFGKNNKVY